jgi:hypothetical protein
MHESNKIIMKKLEDFQKNGFYYEQLKRLGFWAIYKQRLDKGKGCLAYEVIKIREREAGEMVIKKTGQVIKFEAAEYGPSNEDFGYFGWSFPTLERAEQKLKWCIEHEKELSDKKLINKE